MDGTDLGVLPNGCEEELAVHCEGYEVMTRRGSVGINMWRPAGS